MRIILDTGALFQSVALRTLKDDSADVIVPAVAYAERLRHFAVNGASQTDLDSYLARMEFRVEPFGPEEAARFVPGLVDGPTWERLARDAMIAGHVRPGDLLWTTNPKDFLALGVPKDQIVALV
jgi:predicted nucleic acid-binding protein